MSARSAKGQCRRTLRFQSLSDVLAEAQRLVQAPQVTMVGNWTLGQALGHLAAAINYSLDGGKIASRWYWRLVGPLLKTIVLRRMPAGFRLPADAERIGVPPPTMTPAEGLAALARGIARLKCEPQRGSHFVFGQLTREEWNAFHCRHAELHLSFAVTVKGDG